MTTERAVAGARMAGNTVTGLLSTVVLAAGEGTRMRSGYFEMGKQVGEWTTYDKRGKIYKVTRMK